VLGADVLGRVGPQHDDLLLCRGQIGRLHSADGAEHGNGTLVHLPGVRVAPALRQREARRLLAARERPHALQVEFHAGEKCVDEAFERWTQRLFSARCSRLQKE